MKRLLLFLFLMLFSVTLLLSACGTSEESATPTIAPTSTPLPTESQVPRGAIEVPRITVEDLKQRLDNGEAIVVIDTRGKSSYDVRHIRGAIVEPENYDGYPLDQEIVLYCA